MVEIDGKTCLLAVQYLPAMIDENKLRCWLLNVFCSLQAKCPACNEMLEGKAQKSFLQLKRTRCKSCDKTVQFSQGTALKNSRLTHEQFLVLAALAPISTYVTKTHEVLGLGSSVKVFVGSENP